MAITPSVDPKADILVLESLSKTFGNFQAVKGISFTVKQGEVFGFLGPNGAGKSTTIRMILDVLRPTAGSATLFGVSSRDTMATHKRLGFLSGDMVMDNNLTGKQYLTFVAAQYGKDCQARQVELAQLLQADLGKHIGDYSRGNRQKIGLIAALQHQPELLILDEPTSGFDPLVQEQFAELIKQFKAIGGTVFMSSHILSEVQQLCDRVAFIKDGQLADTTTIAKLTENTAKRVHVKASPKELQAIRSAISALHGVKLQVALEEYALVFSYSGQPRPLLRLLAGFEVEDITIKEPDLEEIFMHYYQKAQPAEKQL